LWGCRSLRGRPGLSGSAAAGAGDEMVDGSFRRRRLRPLSLVRSAARDERVSRHFWELAGSLRVISGMWGRWRDRSRVRWLQFDWGECVGPELAQDVEAAAGEFAGDGQ
jgi:hypothetical protein